jgi:lysozyme
MNYAIGNDISAWQNDITTPRGVDFQKMKSAGSKFCFMRAFFGLMKDRDFDGYWIDAKKAGIPRGAYFFPLTTYSITEQANNFCALLKQDKGELPPVIDIERYKGTVPSGADIKLCIQIIKKNLGVDPLIYTGFYMWRDEVAGSSDAFFANYPLWIATYATSPMIPKPWKDWTFWQYTDKGDGLKYGVESLNIDMDYFNGTEQQFDTYIGNTNPNPEPEPDPNPEPSEGLTFTAINQMNIRKSPSISSSIVGTLPAGSKVTAIDVGGDDAWIMIGENMWVCNSRKGNTFL